MGLPAATGDQGTKTDFRIDTGLRGGYYAPRHFRLPKEEKRMFPPIPRIISSALGLGLLSLTLATARADIAGHGLTILTADTNGNSASYTAEVVWTGDRWSFELSEMTELRDPDNNELVATLNPPDLGAITSIEYFTDPVVSLNFSVQAGGTTTTFMIASALLSFPTLNNPDGAASAAYSVSDFTGNGATLTGIGDPGGAGGAYLAQYNGFAGTVSGTTFAELHQQIIAGPFSTNTSTEEQPPGGGFQPISGAVNDMSALVSFTLTPFDLASGTTTYVIVPEPASLVPLMLGVGLLRRR